MGDMHANFLAFAVSVGAVTLAEMGDKTQLLAMAFATRFKTGKVLLGVFVATILNHALAVAVGSLLSKVPGLDVWIQGVAALSFIFFGLWTLKGDKLDGNEVRKKSRFGVVATVAIAFFIAELGDKTQLATIALAAKYSTTPFEGVFVLAGTTTGMMIADAIGIVVSVVLCRRIPERTVKLVSAGAFAVFGFYGGFQVLAGRLGLPLGATLGILATVAVVTGVISFLLIRANRPVENEAVAEYCAVRRLGDDEGLYEAPPEVDSKKDET